jgi:hypothetical protein
MNADSRRLITKKLSAFIRVHQRLKSVFTNPQRAMCGRRTYNSLNHKMSRLPECHLFSTFFVPPTPFPSALCHESIVPQPSEDLTPHLTIPVEERHEKCRSRPSSPRPVTHALGSASPFGRKCVTN